MQLKLRLIYEKRANYHAFLQKILEEKALKNRLRVFKKGLIEAIACISLNNQSYQETIKEYPLRINFESGSKAVLFIGAFLKILMPSLVSHFFRFKKID